MSCEAIYIIDTINPLTLSHTLTYTRILWCDTCEYDLNEQTEI